MNRQAGDLLDYGALFDNRIEDVPVPIMVTDATPAIVHVNRAFTRVTGYNAVEVLGRNPRVLASGLQSREFYRRMWVEIAARGAWEGEIWDRRKNGEIFREMLAISAVRGGHGEITHYIGTFRDITSRKERVARLQRLSCQASLTHPPARALLAARGAFGV